MKKVAVVILNWNGKDWLEKFLPSVVANTSTELAEIIVVDNASSDQSIDFLQNFYPSIQRICFEENLGFTGGYNQSIKQLDHPYIVLLNSDVKPGENWLEPMVRLMESDRNIAACQPKILSYDQPTHFEYAGASGGMIDALGYPFCRGRIFDTLEADNKQYDDAKKVFWASGACMLVRTELYKKLGGLDELFFAHMEEIDLCWRMQNEGYDVWVEPLACVYHVGGGTLQAGNPKKTYYNFRNSLLMILKNRPFFIAYCIIFCRLLLDGLAGLQFILKGQFKHFFAILNAHFSFYRHQFSYWKNRGPKRNIPTISSFSILVKYFLQGKRYFQSI